MRDEWSEAEDKAERDPSWKKNADYAETRLRVIARQLAVEAGRVCASCRHRPVEAWMAEDGRGGGVTLPCPKCGVANLGAGESVSAPQKTT